MFDHGAVSKDQNISFGGSQFRAETTQCLSTTSACQHMLQAECGLIAGHSVRHYRSEIHSVGETANGIFCLNSSDSVNDSQPLRLSNSLNGSWLCTGGVRFPAAAKKCIKNEVTPSMQGESWLIGLTTCGVLRCSVVWCGAMLCCAM